MAEFSDRLKKISQRNLKVKHEKHTTWPLEKRIEVVSQFLVLGNMKLVAATTGVSHSLIREWKGQPWWKELENEIRQTQNIEMDTKLSKIVDRSLDAVMDRIENGDFIYDNKTGQIKRKPANLRDVARVSVDMISKRELIRHGVEDRKESTQIAVAEQLKLLAAEFTKWNGRKPVVEVIDVVPREVTEDAVHEEREEGLQEGERDVQLSSGRSEEARGEEQGESDL